MQVGKVGITFAPCPLDRFGLGPITESVDNGRAFADGGQNTFFYSAGRLGVAAGVEDDPDLFWVRLFAAFAARSSSLHAEIK